MAERAPLPSRQRQRQRFHDALREIVLEPKEVTDGNLRGVRPDDAASRSFDELHADAELLADA